MAILSTGPRPTQFVTIKIDNLNLTDVFNIHLL